MRRYASTMLSHQIRGKFGLKTTIPPLHHVFTGNPGKVLLQYIIYIISIYHVYQYQLITGVIYRYW